MNEDLLTYLQAMFPHVHDEFYVTDASKVNALIKFIEKGKRRKKLSTAKRPYLERVGLFPICDIIPHINKGTSLNLMGHEVPVSSLRLRTFAVRGTICMNCGLRASFFALEESTQSSPIDPIKYHLNLYGIDSSGDEVLFTRDHIHPVSKGGVDHISNLQTMCKPCNEKKGNSTKWKI